MKKLTDQLRHAMSQTVRITDDEWAAFEPFIQFKKIKKREKFAAEGQICRDIGFILRGSFRQFYVVDGEEKSTFFMFENSLRRRYSTNGGFLFEKIVGKHPLSISVKFKQF